MNHHIISTFFTLKRISFIIIITFLAACTADIKTAQISNSEQSKERQQIQSESQHLSEFFKHSFQEDLTLSPMKQSYLGYKWDYDKWDDISIAQQEAYINILQKRLKNAKLFDQSRLTNAEKMSLTIYIADVQRRLANDQFRHHRYIMHQFRAWHTTVPSFLINIHRVSDINDAKAYISRLEKVLPLFEQVIIQLKLREEKGVFPPKWAYDQMLNASANVIQGKPFTDSQNDSTIWSDFKNKVAKLNIENSEKEHLLSQAKQALLTGVKPAYEKLMQALTKQKTMSPEGDGVWRLPNGSAWYKNRLAWFTTTQLNAQQVHEIGLAHVNRIHLAMQDIMQQVNFTGDLQAFFDFMRNDPQFYYANDEEGRQRYMSEAKALIDTMRAKLPEYFGIVPKADMIIKRVEAFREQSAGKAFYQSPSKDGTRPGIYYANLYDLSSMPTYQMEALAYHEGIPGHHMQRSIAQELEGIPEFQKYVSFTAYTEGWGLYTEELGKDMGFYQNPYSDFGRLAMELWRACRLVVDTGIHEMKWSREQAIQYLIENTPNPENDSVKAIERYIAMPGQATAYMIGKLKIMELREKAQKTLGDKFDYRGFHDEILKDGPVPMTILEEKINRWIMEQH